MKSNLVFGYDEKLLGCIPVGRKARFSKFYGALNMKTGLVWFALFTIGLVTSVSAQDDALFCGEQFAIAHLNANSWVKYDTLMKEATLIRDESSGASDKTKTLDRSVRLAIDWDANELFFVSKIEMESVGQSKQEFDLELISKSKAFSRWVRFPGRSLRIEEGEELLMTLRKPSMAVADYRFIGMQSFPAEFGLGFSHQVTPLKVVRSSDSTTVFRSGNSIRVSTKLGGTFVHIREFDAKSLMLKQMYIRSNEDGRIVFDQDYRWIEKDGLYLPVEIVSENFEFETNLTYFSTITILWRSINEPLDRAFFDIKAVDDFKKAQGFIDEESFKNGGCLNFE